MNWTPRTLFRLPFMEKTNSGSLPAARATLDGHSHFRPANATSFHPPVPPLLSPNSFVHHRQDAYPAWCPVLRRTLLASPVISATLYIDPTTLAPPSSTNSPFLPVASCPKPQVLPNRKSIARKCLPEPLVKRRFIVLICRNSIGILLAVGSGVLIGSSFVFKKKGLLSSQKGKVAGEGVGYLKSVSFRVQFPENSTYVRTPGYVVDGNDHNDSWCVYLGPNQIVHSHLFRRNM